MTTVGDAIAALEAAYPPGLAADWDAVGLVCGDPGEPLTSVLVCVDPVPETVDEAVDGGAQLLVAHHPLLLRGVHGVGADTPKGALVHRLVRAGTALFTAHTNADAADPGVSDALAAAVGLDVEGPLVAEAAPPLDKIITFVPTGPDLGAVHAALAAAGAGNIGDYSHCSFATAGTGQFKPLAGAHPTIGEVGRLERVAETRLEMVLPRHRRAAVVAALRAAHPYEEPAFDLLELAPIPSTLGLGRIGTLPGPEPLSAFTARVAAGLPPRPGACAPRATPAGRSAGSPSAAGRGTPRSTRRSPRASTPTSPPTCATTRRRSTCCGPAAPALVDVAHWASEWPWCAQAAAVLRAALGGSVEVRVSTRRTDPWSIGSIT